MILKSRHGQSLMELLIGMAVGAVFIIGAASVIVPSLQVSKQAGNVQAEAQIAQDTAANIQAWAANNWGAVLSLATGTTNGYYLNTSVSPFTAVALNQSTIVVTFTSNGTWTKPAGLISANIQVVGGGGGGGGSGNGYGGGGGGSSAFGTSVIASGGGGGGSWSGCTAGLGGDGSGGGGGSGSCGGTAGSGGGGGAYAQSTITASNLASNVSVYVGQGGSTQSGNGTGGSGYFNGGTAAVHGGGGGGGATGVGANGSGNAGGAGGTGASVGTTVTPGSAGCLNTGTGCDATGVGGTAGGPIGGAGGSGGSSGLVPGGGGGGGIGGPGAAGEVVVTQLVNSTSSLAGQPVSVCNGGNQTAGAYSYGRPITIDHTKIPNTDQTNFPVLFSGTFSYLKTVANGGNVQNVNGYDIVFTSDAAGKTPLAFEQDSYSSSTGAVNYWIKVPTVSHTADTVIYIWYGASSISTSQANAAAVWTNSYNGVWHFPNGTVLTGNDSTASGNTGTPGAMAAAGPGQIGGAAVFNGGATSYVLLSAASTSAWNIAGDASVSAWVNSTSNGKGIFDMQNGNPLIYLEIGPTTVGGTANKAVAYFRTNAGSVLVASGNITVNDGKWHYIEAVRSAGGASVKIYVDGVLDTTTGYADAGAISVGSSGANVGWGGTYGITGSIDEVHFSSAARSADWVAAEYANQKNPTTFATVGSVLQANCVSYSRYFYLTDVYRDSGGNATTTQAGNYYDPSTKLVTVIVYPTASPSSTITYPFYITRSGSNVLNQGTWIGGAVGANGPVTFVSSTYGSATSVIVTASGTLNLGPSAAPGGACYTNSNSSLLLGWPINEGSGTVVYDTSGNNFNASWNGTPVVAGSYYSPGTVGSSAAYFNGVDDYLQVPSAMAASLGGSLTVSAWIKMTACNSWSRILDLGNGSPSNNIIFAATNGTSCKPDLDLENGGTSILSMTAPSGVALNTWTLVTAVVSGTSSVMYINGSQVAVGTLSAALTTGTRNSSYIGKSDWVSDGMFSGSIDDVRIYNTALSAGNVASIYSGSPPSSGLVAEYNFENNPNDSSGGGNTATWFGTQAYGALYYTTGNVSTYAGSFNGSNNYLQTPNLAILNTASSSFSIAGWVNPTAAGDVLTETGATTLNTGWHDTWIEILGTKAVKMRVWNCTVLTPGSISAFSTWNHLALVYNGSSSVLTSYLNGVATASSTESCTRSNPAGGGAYGEYLNVGAFDSTANMGSGAYFSGAIDGMVIYNRALSSGEVNTLYTGGQVN